MKRPIQPLGKLFTILTKQYINLLSNRLEDVPIDRYFYPLYLISKSEALMSQTDLAEQLFVDKVTVVRIIDYLEKNKMAVREEHPSDRRCHILKVSPNGEQYIPLIENAMIEINEFFLNKIDEPLKSVFQEELTLLANDVVQIPGHRYDILYNKIS